MEKITNCEFNLDSGCVEIRFADGTMLAIDCEAVEEVYDISIANRSELDWLIYNNPLEYAYHVLKGSVREYLKGNHEHRLMDSSGLFVSVVPAGYAGGDLILNVSIPQNQQIIHFWGILRFFLFCGR